MQYSGNRFCKLGKCTANRGEKVNLWRCQRVQFIVHLKEL